MKKIIFGCLLLGSCMAGSGDFQSNGLLLRLLGILESVGVGSTSQEELTLSGFLKDEDGNAIANATLTVQSESSSALRASSTTTTDSEGKFSLSFKIGNYKVVIQSSSGNNLGIYSVSATNPSVQPVLTLQSGNLILTINNYNNGAASQSPSLLTFASSSYIFTSGIGISKITPTVSGALTSCTARPSLPTGLSLSSTCEISGTPTEIQSSVAYLIRGRNPYGDTITKITITVNTQPPSNLLYIGSPFILTQGTSISTIVPSVSGTVTSCSISPNLTNETGLIFNPTNCAISGTPNLVRSATNYTVTASNSNGSTDTTINLTVNNSPPSGLSYAGSPFVFTQNIAFSPISPTVNGTITSCSIFPNLTTDTGLSFNTTNCTISGTPTLVKTATNYTVTASNSNGSTNTIINLRVNIAPPSSLSYSGSPFVFTQNLAIQTRTPSVTGTITSCSISPNLTTNTGLTFNTTNCSISGTPTQVRSATNYTVTASNSNGSTSTTMNITVNIAPPSNLSYSGSPFVFTQNVAITSRTPTVTGTVTSCSISPNIQTDTGLNFNSTNCTISGTPTIIRTATNYMITASNSNGSTSTTVNITVNIAPPSNLSYSGSPFVFTQNVAIISQSPTVTGTVTSCSISPNIQTDTGLNFNTTNCTISGTPTIIKTATNYTITASNSNGSTSTTVNVTVNIAPPSSLSYSGSPFVFTQNLAITSRTPTVTGTVTSCTISPNLQTDTGLNFNSTNCTISGTPTIIKTATNYTISASNSNGSTSTTVNVTVNIAPPSSLSYSGSPFVFTQNVAITSQSPAVSGTVTSCSISPNIQTDTGLNFNTTNCTISGTPTIIKTATNYMITASNSNGSTSTTVNITVNIAPPSSLSYSGSPFVFTQNVAITSRTPTVIGTVSSCSISPNIQTDTGLNFNTTNCTISGTPTIIKTATNYMITASNSNGSTSTTVNITVNIAPPSNLSYSGSPFVFTQNVAITSRTPTVTGTVTSCTISPNLQTDTGLNFNSINCTISGTPTIIKTATNYTVTASNSNGSTITTINITVNNAPPSNLSYSPSSFRFIQNISISTITPSFLGSITSCTSNPDLPSGLLLNDTTCSISGIPLNIQSIKNYTITASNSTGSTTRIISITIDSDQIISMRLGLLKTGQTTVYGNSKDDGHYQSGLFRGFIIGGSSGLLWQRCSGGQNNDANCSGNARKYTLIDSIDYCSTLNLNNKSWRLPSLNELANLLNYEINSNGSVPKIDSNFFPNSAWEEYWTINQYAQDINYNWIVHFGTGGIGGNGYLTNYVRCVSGTLSTTISLSDLNNGVIKDNTSDLLWQKCTTGQDPISCSGSPLTLNWINSISSCEGLTLGGYSDWRLPNVNEYRSIIDYSTSSIPAINTKFINTSSNSYWTSTSLNSNTAYIIRLLDGFISPGSNGDKVNGSNHVRCVRGP